MILRRLITLGAPVLIAASAHAAGAEGLFGYAGGLLPPNGLFDVEANPVSATLLGFDPTIERTAEIEYGNGLVYVADAMVGTDLHAISPLTGLIQSTLSMNLPIEGNVITSMEFVGGTLYGGLTSQAGGETFLSIIQTMTGDVSLVGGPTGVGFPLGGLAYDTVTETMYAVSAGGTDGGLYTIDLDDGAASLVAPVTLAGNAVTMSALEFGTDGVLYGLGNVASGVSGHLLAIDPVTGAAIDLGDTGIVGLNALTSIPGPATLAVFAAIALVGRRRRERAAGGDVPS